MRPVGDRPHDRHQDASTGLDVVDSQTRRLDHLPVDDVAPVDERVEGNERDVLRLRLRPEDLRLSRRCDPRREIRARGPQRRDLERRDRRDWIRNSRRRRIRIACHPVGSGDVSLSQAVPTKIASEHQRAVEKRLRLWFIRQRLGMQCMGSATSIRSPAFQIRSTVR
jgi:hypothetical protein